MAFTWKKGLLITGGAVAGGALCFVTAGAAAPAVGALIGSGMGLSGAAATSAGLATLGGGALAAGGAGMAGGVALVTSIMTGLGTTLGALGLGTLANFLKDSNKELREAIEVQKDYAKAQAIILQQEEKLQRLEGQLRAERDNGRANAKRVAQLEKAVDDLAKMIEANKQQLAYAKG